MSENGIVSWSANEDGYEVTVVDGCNVLDHYTASNNPYDSQQACPPDESPVPLRTLRKYARQTAKEVAAEHGISNIEEDS
jgi:hypothetical protein